EGSSLSVPASAIKRLTINRNPYSAQFRGPGKARIEVVTDRGSRRLVHGNASMFVRNAALDARNAFAVTTPALDRRLWESTLGGPLPGKGFSFYLTGNRLINNNSAIVNALVVGGAFNAGPSQVFSTMRSPSMRAQEVATFLRGPHTITLGASIRPKDVHVSDASNFGGTFTFGDLAHFASGTPFLYRVNVGSP